MEDALVQGKYCEKCINLKVLILVLMEDALVLLKENVIYFSGSSLNPCFNGRCTSTYQSVYKVHDYSLVLILVLMEDALVLGDTTWIGQE